MVTKTEINKLIKEIGIDKLRSHCAMQIVEANLEDTDGKEFFADLIANGCKPITKATVIAILEDYDNDDISELHKVA